MRAIARAIVRGAVAHQLTGPGLGGGWTPAQWFLASEQGAWYDPSDMSTMFQDSAGTTPVTAMEQPVGLILDKRLGLVRGPELMINGDFSAGNANWSSSVTGANAITFSGGSVRLQTTGADTASLYQSSVLTIGKNYCIEFDVLPGSSGILKVLPLGTTGEVEFSCTPGRKMFIGVALSAAIVIARVVGQTADAYIDNISVRELPGNHASQATSAKRPVLSARKNLLDATEGLVTTYGTRANVIQAATTIPGYAAAVHFNDGVLDAYAYKTMTPTHTTGATYRLSAYVQMDDGLAPVPGGNNAVSDFGLVVGGAIVTAPTATPLGSGLYRVEGSAVAAGANQFGVVKWAANTARTFKVTGYQVEISPTATTYQRVTIATDYDTVGFPHYLKFDGVDDFLQTGSIDFTATDKMGVFAGVTKLSDAAIGVVAETSTTSSTTNGSFTVWAPPNNGLARYAFTLRGTLTAAFQGSNPHVHAAPLTSVLSCAFDTSLLAAELAIKPRVNGAAMPAAHDGLSGTSAGNFGNYPLYIGRRAGSAYPFNGHLYSLIVRGAASDAGQVASAESYTAGKTGVTLP